MADFRSPPLSRPLRLLLGVSVFLLALSGLAQMPIMKRYYIADLPGLAWLADFFATSLLHYLAAAVFLFLCGLIAAGRLASPQPSRLSGYEKIRLTLYLLVITTGLAHVAHNTTSWPLPPALAQTAILAHLVGVMALALTWAGWKLFTRRKAGRG